MRDEVALDGSRVLPDKRRTPVLRYLWYSDLYRYAGEVNAKYFIMAFLRAPGFRYSFFLRLCSYFLQGKPYVFEKVLYRINFEIMRQVGIRFGITISRIPKLARVFIS
jgi:hypothetical protein